ncbi:unnamed protein product [Vitrella brassicaformis CCMP3155]|uniref:BTB domain-containing protein n=1 Tax=Vitrella brassicaformis (strain CCMP3155) TaxID=1169540 RepID=A0A0G4FC65_VITBC|nr:unnamed protein product [Vitrella brassicaformis CCMP3155]|eukprot:CEM10207.1 unnamed protein product [Vitrella brassicaformis CCMP3155]
MTSFVRLNVGGREFSVAKSTLAIHPHTLLGQLVTNESTAEYQQIQQGQPVFIDRDPALFSHVLDYYRDGLPLLIDASVDTRKLIREMRFFGIDVSESDLQGPPPSEQERASRREATMRRVANKVTLGLLARLRRDITSTGSWAEVQYDQLIVAAAEWVGGPEAAEIRAFPGDIGKVAMLFGMVRQEMEREAVGFRFALIPTVNKTVVVKIYRANA